MYTRVQVQFVQHLRNILALERLVLAVGWLSHAFDVNELVRTRVRLRRALDSSPFAGREAQEAGFSPDDQLLRFLRWLLLRQSARGGEVRCLTGFNEIRTTWQEIRADRLKWTTAISVP